MFLLACVYLSSTISVISVFLLWLDRKSIFGPTKKKDKEKVDLIYICNRVHLHIYTVCRSVNVLSCVDVIQFFYVCFTCHYFGRHKKTRV